MLRFFEALTKGTPSGIVKLDSNMLLMKNRIMRNKLKYMGKIMAKSTAHNMCRRALITAKMSVKARTYSLSVKTGVGNSIYKILLNVKKSVWAKMKTTQKN